MKFVRMTNDEIEMELDMRAGEPAVTSIGLETYFVVALVGRSEGEFTGRLAALVDNSVVVVHEFLYGDLYA